MYIKERCNMMWTRKELKERAKEALKRNYWKIVLVSLIGMLIGGGLGSSGISGGGSDIRDMASDNVKEHFTEHENDDVDWEGAEAVLDDIQMDIRPQDIVAVAFTVIVVLIVAAIVLAIVLALDVLLLNPVQVGINRFMVKSLDDTARIAEVGYTFDHNYKNGVKVMFFKDLYVVLWSLLFIVPGIYKAYQYRMVPYILGENPDMTYQEVLQRSKDMMDGQKWDAFVLDLSFILWHMLGGITCGLAEIFYVAPYVNLTDAALYSRLSRKDLADAQSVPTTMMQL
ncbi:MAG: hypothetical protein DBY13_00710 [Lachnospiraceae bacterium]|jgi:hypothetical protein|nr:MAG: hypothetical protein DBY13_00710 [Lachnospiraceae bacterium]HCI25216.1 hypothetical protein [Lachnospiraceae bacterium]